MDSLQNLKNQAMEKLGVADHLVSTTYSLVKEPKLLVSVIENIFAALDLTMTALIEYEKNFKAIPNYDNFETKMELFKRKVATKYNISSDITEFIIDIKKTLDSHKKSNVEFSKKETFVITDNDYNLTTLNVDDVKKILLKAKNQIIELFNLIKYEDN